MTDTFYRTFSEKQLTGLGGARRGAHRARAAGAPHAQHAIAAGTDARDRAGPRLARGARDRRPAGSTRAIEPSPLLAERLRARGARGRAGVDAARSRRPTRAADVLYADQVLEHMSGIDAARAVRRPKPCACCDPGGVVLRRRSRLPEGARVLLGHRLHAQLPDDRAAGAAALLRRRIRRSSASCAASASPPARRATCWPARRCSSTSPGSTRCRATRGRKSCSTRSARTSSRR